MTAPNNLMMIASLLLVLSLVGRKSKAAPRSQEKTDQVSSGAEGKATICYEYSHIQENDWTSSISAEVPVTIKRDEVFPEKWYVRGSKRTTYAAQGQTSDPDGFPASISRDVEVRIFFDGELITGYDEGEPSCQFHLKNFFVTDLFQPASAYDGNGALPEKDWIFDQYNRVVHVPRSEDQNLKAMITDIQWPLEMREVCKWA
jgi:hypothetical protein